MLTEMSVIGLNPVAHISQLTASQQTELSANPQMNANNLLGGFVRLGMNTALNPLTHKIFLSVKC